MKRILVIMMREGTMGESLPAQEHGDWHVFETIVADGTWSIGIGEGTPNPELVMVIADRLSRSDAIRIARQRANERAGDLPALSPDPELGS